MRKEMIQMGTDTILGIRNEKLEPLKELWMMDMHAEGSFFHGLGWELRGGQTRGPTVGLLQLFSWW
jgi:hypothetical protein